VVTRCGGNAVRWITLKTSDGVMALFTRLFIIEGRSLVGWSQLLPNEATTIVTWFRGSSWLASPHYQLHFYGYNEFLISKLILGINGWRRLCWREVGEGEAG
jgi:hypothetical protein